MSFLSIFLFPNIGRSDVTEMMKSPAAAEKVKATMANKVANAGNANSQTGSGGHKNKKAFTPDSDAESSDIPVAKKKKVELVFEDELKAKEDNIANGGSGTKHISKFLI